MSQQGLKQASIRGVTSTTWTHEGDWNALFTAAGIAAGTFNERLLLWINARLTASHTNLPAAMAAMAAAEGAANFGSIGTFTP